MMNQIWVEYFFVTPGAGSDANVAFLFLLMRMGGYAFALLLKTLPSVNDVRICHLSKIIIMGAYLG
jgi:hypothetical protein